MKKKIIISLFLALVMVFSLAGSVLADPPQGPHNPPPSDPDEVSVTVDIDGPDAGTLGEEVTVTATVTAVAVDGDKQGQWEEAYSSSGYWVTAPDSTTVDNGYDYLGTIWGSNGADASNVYVWTITFTLEQVGDYLVDAWGYALADYIGWGWYWDDVDYDSQTFTIAALQRLGWYYNGQFELAISTLEESHQGYDYTLASGLQPTDGPSAGQMVLDQGVTQYGDASGRLIRVDLPEGASITDEDGNPVYRLLLKYHDCYGIDPYVELINEDAPSGYDEIHFSQPLEISIGSDYNPVVSIMDVYDGIVDL